MMFDVSKVMISLKPAHKVKPHKLRLTPHLPGRDGAPSPWQWAVTARAAVSGAQPWP